MIVNCKNVFQKESVPIVVQIRFNTRLFFVNTNCLNFETVVWFLPFANQPLH